MLAAGGMLQSGTGECRVMRCGRPREMGGGLPIFGAVITTARLEWVVVSDLQVGVDAVVGVDIVVSSARVEFVVFVKQMIHYQDPQHQSEHSMSSARLVCCN